MCTAYIIIYNVISRLGGVAIEPWALEYNFDGFRVNHLVRACMQQLINVVPSFIYWNSLQKFL